MKALLKLVIALPFAISAKAALAAGSYSGSWPVTVTHSQHSNGSYCLTLAGRRDSSASVSNFGNGVFEVLNHTLVATIDVSDGDYVTYPVITAPVANGSFGKGIFDYANGSYPDAGEITFGKQGGC